MDEKISTISLSLINSSINNDLLTEKIVAFRDIKRKNNKTFKK